jgi:hypothetical protein
MAFVRPDVSDFAYQTLPPLILIGVQSVCRGEPRDEATGWALQD